ncbi:cytochrome P450 [Saccharata proteae CBS 121410]|uniref:Cytochrome P450 n=1 Tax=Saccharata proteae CBS 121410 TaxID=1314787 RepID=A0A9P4HQW4_9PEZI|nr:cytochrome P450 [Saccharata proteae CBS 121410]
MPLHPTFILPFLLILLTIPLYNHILHPIFLSPLAKIPSAHPTVCLSSAWLKWQKYRGKLNPVLLAAHKRWGPVVRVGPREVSVNCVKGGLQTVYLGGFEKDGFYQQLFGNLGTSPMVAIRSSKPHSIRKRMVTHIYSKSSIQTSTDLRAIAHTVLLNRLLPVLHSAAKASSPVDAWSLLGGVAIDISTGYIFGLDASSDLTSKEEYRREVEKWFYSLRPYSFWTQEMPGLTSFLRKIGIKLIPNAAKATAGGVERFVTQMCDKAAEKIAPSKYGPEGGNKESHVLRPVGHYPTVYAQLSSAMCKDALKSGLSKQTVRKNMAGELMDHTLAGYETSQLTLTYLVWELSRHRNLQDALRAELRKLQPPVKAGESRLPDPKVLDALPLLHAILWETLRLYPGTPGPQPRVTPEVAGGSTLGPPGAEYAGISGGVRVAAAAYCLHRNEDVFPQPEVWLPERWLDGQGRKERAIEMGRWFWAFGSGGRMCIGNHLAIYQIKFIVAALYTSFTTSIVDDEGIEPSGHFVAHPISKKLVVRFQEA